MTRAILLTFLISGLAFLQLSACTGGTWSNGPGISLSGPHSPNLALGGGGPSSITFRGGSSADPLSLP
jgi:hypothetical protein